MRVLQYMLTMLLGDVVLTEDNELRIYVHIRSGGCV